MTEIQTQDIKTALSLLLKDSEPVEIVKRGIESVKPYMQGFYATVTYTEVEPIDSPLVLYLKEQGFVVSFFKWENNFAKARNFALDQVPPEFHYILWIDADDVVAGAEHLPQIIKDAYIYNHTAVFFDYYYMVELNERGEVKEVLVQHKRERLIKNDHTFKWQGRLHETMIEQKQVNVTKVYRPEVKIIHLTSDDRSRENLNRNITILESMLLEEQRKDPRTLMYLAKAYFDRAKIVGDKDKRKIDFDLAMELFYEFLEGVVNPGIEYKSPSGWREERSNAWQYIGEICRMDSQFNNAIKATANSMIEWPLQPMYWLDMAMNYTLLKDYEYADFWLERAKGVPIPNTTIILTPRDLKTRALEIDYHIAKGKNDLERAERSAEKLAEIFPNSKDFLDRKNLSTHLKSLNKVAQSLVYAARYLADTNQKEKVVSLINSIPREIEHEQFASQMRNQFMQPRMWEKNEVAIICGPGFEKWSPKNVEQGIGGSEGAVIYMARELTKLGYKVTVFGDPREDMGEYDGVTYKQWYEINTKDLFNVLILWRSIAFTDGQFFAKRCYLWMHDVPNPPDFTEERLKKIDKIFVLSEYHKSLFRMAKGNEFVEIPQEKFFLTTNGIPDVEVEGVDRDPHRMIYTSSIDRGLAYLLNIWPEIRQEVPDATLHVYYGTHVFDFIYRDNPERQQWRSNMIKLMQQEGITYHGRVGHKELAQEYKKSGIFAYSCTFNEISCIAAMCAQKYGAIPVVPNVYALKETVKFGKKIDDCQVDTKEGLEKYKNELIEALKNVEWQKELRPKMMEESKDKYAWASVATQWKELFSQEKK